MTVALCCPNCGREVGLADTSNNYQEQFHNKNEEGEPICLTCGTGKDVGHKILYVSLGIILLVVFISAMYV